MVLFCTLEFKFFRKEEKVAGRKIVHFCLIAINLKVSLISINLNFDCFQRKSTEPDHWLMGHFCDKDCKNKKRFVSPAPNTI